jgi:methionine synthase II (cobalamin-independent)
VSAIPWRPAVASSIGSFPGTSALETARIVVGELPDLIHVAELPARGPGADMIGRTGGVLSAVSTGLGLETTPDGWRFARASGREMRRAISFLGEDLDALEQSAVGYAGPVKCQLVGPWTLAAAIELPTGERALRDPAAVWDIAQALSEAIRVHVADIRRRLPLASVVVVQIDEPSLPAVLAGRIGTASGLSSYRAVDVQDAERVLGHVLTAGSSTGAFAGVHCCAEDVPVDLLRTSGAAFVSLDMTALESSPRLDEEIGQVLDDGLGILAGTVPAVGVQTHRGELGEERASAPLRAVLHRLGLDDGEWLAQVAITPACGLAGASPQWARAALAACRAAGRIVRDDEVERTEDDRER